MHAVHAGAGYQLVQAVHAVAGFKSIHAVHAVADFVAFMPFIVLLNGSTSSRVQCSAALSLYRQSYQGTTGKAEGTAFQH